MFLHIIQMYGIRQLLLQFKVVEKNQKKNPKIQKFQYFDVQN